MRTRSGIPERLLRLQDLHSAGRVPRRARHGVWAWRIRLVQVSTGWKCRTLSDDGDSSWPRYLSPHRWPIQSQL